MEVHQSLVLHDFEQLIIIPHLLPLRQPVIVIPLRRYQLQDGLHLQLDQVALLLPVDDLALHSDELPLVLEESFLELRRGSLVTDVAISLLKLRVLAEDSAAYISHIVKDAPHLA
jgi:hypothetical protein